MAVVSDEAVDERTTSSRYVTRGAVARLLGVSPNTVSRWAREGRIQCQKTLGGHRRFDRTLIEDLSRRLRSGSGIPG
jgi:excisionase family DNA binding protein